MYKLLLSFICCHVFCLIPCHLPPVLPVITLWKQTRITNEPPWPRRRQGIIDTWIESPLSLLGIRCNDNHILYLLKPFLPRSSKCSLCIPCGLEQDWLLAQLWIMWSVNYMKLGLRNHSTSSSSGLFSAPFNAGPWPLPASPFLFSPVPHSSPWSLALNHRSTNLSFKGWLLVLLLWCYFPQKHLHFNRTHLQTEKSKEIKLNSRIIGK